MHAPRRLCRPLPIVLLAMSLVFTAAPVAAAPPPPILVSPADGATVTLPTFVWQAASGASYYEIQVATNSGFSGTVWTETTYDLTITPVTDLPIGPLWWRVRSSDGANAKGAWSTAWSLTLQIPGPTLAAPANGSTTATPSFRWQAATGAVFYHVEVAANDAFAPLLWEEDTYDLSITPATKTLPDGLLYWRVEGMDTEGQSGTYSGAWSFTKQIPGPGLVGPANGSTIVWPNFQWQAEPGAVFYRIEVSTNNTFTALVYEEDTYDLTITPATITLPNGVLYWRIKGRDTEGHYGTASAVWSFTKQIPAPVLVGPGDGADLAQPNFQWSPSEGATMYRIEVSTNDTFTGIVWQQDTFDTAITPVDRSRFPAGAYYWRVRGRDIDNHDGANSAVRTVDMLAPAACSNPHLELVSPPSGIGVDRDPTFAWECMQGATTYKVEIYRETTLYGADFSDFLLYTPYASDGSARETLPDGAYQWHVKAYQGGTVLETSVDWAFTKTTPFALVSPANAAVVTADPVLQWQAYGGADRYRIAIYKGVDLYGADYTHYTAYTPYNSGGSAKQVLENGAYTWKVEAYLGSILLATSPDRTFTKAAGFGLLTPAEGAGVAADPDTSWQPLQGADRYRVEIYQGADLYDADYSFYPAYTPYASGGSAKQVFANGTYTWKVKGYYGGAILLHTTTNRTFTKAAVFNLLSPANGAELSGDPTLRWEPLLGADRYRVAIYKGGLLYNSDWTYYPAYTPFASGGSAKETLGIGTYTWKIEAYYGGSILIATSGIRTFTIGKRVFLPSIVKN